MLSRRGLLSRLLIIFPTTFFITTSSKGLNKKIQSVSAETFTVAASWAKIEKFIVGSCSLVLSRFLIAASQNFSETYK